MAAEKINILFGKHLKKIRAQKGLNQDDVAAMCGIDPTSISRLERGETNATLTTLFRLSKGLCIPMRDLVDVEQTCYTEMIDDDLIFELRMQLGQLADQEQQFVLEFIQRFVQLKSRS